jgi:hypothetical protein
LPRDNFLPWHRVRKQYVRRYQWNHLAVRMIKNQWRRQLCRAETEWSLDPDGADAEEVVISASDTLGNPLRCLLIPGDDLLDLRSLWGEMRPYNCGIRYLGFNESAGSNQGGTRVHIANNAVTSLHRVARDSQVIADRFESIANSASRAYQYLKEYGPYHIVNLDFCGSVFPNRSNDALRYLSAIHQLLAYQFGCQTSDWLLFVTTEVEPSQADTESLQVLCKPTRKNRDTHASFAQRLAKLLPPDAFESDCQTIDLFKIADDQMVDLFGVAFGKWLLGICHDAYPRWTVAMRRSYRYKINVEKNVVMLSLAFELRPNIVAPADHTGLSNVSIPPKRYPDEEECAVKLVDSVGGIADIDALLAENADLRADLMNAQADLLDSAGYDRHAYLEWVKNGELI